MTIFSRLSLKRRIAVLSALLGIALSGAFAILAWWIAEDYEELLIGLIIDAEADDARAALARDAEPRMPGSARLSGWYLQHGTPPPKQMPPALRQLPVGIHEGLPGLPAGLHATVIAVDSGRLIYLVDLERIEVLERYLLVASLSILLFGGLTSALLSQWLAGRALRPLTHLAASIEVLPTSPAVRQWVPDLHDPLLQRVGHALEGYQRRLADAEQARAAFFADASHELRAPIASLRGAVEVLLDDATTDAAARRRLDRIQRAVEELGQLLDGLLASARALPVASATCRLDEPLRSAVEQLQTRAGQRGVHLSIKPESTGPALLRPAAWIEVLLLNLLRGILDRPGVDAIQIIPQGPRVHIRVIGANPEDWGLRSDRGFGLRLASTLATHLGVRVESDETALWLDFSAVLAGAAAAPDSVDNGSP